MSVVYHEAESNEWVEEHEWIGIFYEKDITASRALITPLAFRNDDNIWKTITANDCRQYFPNNGKIVYFVANFPSEKGNQFYGFRPRRNPQLTPDKPGYSTFNYSHYLLPNEELTSAPLAQIFDWSARGQNLFELPELLEQGIAAEDCLVPKMYIRYQNYLYGPIQLEPDRTNPQYLKPREYQLGSSSGGTLLLNEHFLDKTNIVFLENRQFVDPQTLNAPRERIDWSLPKTVIKRALHACKYNLTDLKEPTRLVDRYINELADLISAGGPQALQIESSTIQRAQYIVQHQLERLDDLQALIEELPERHPLLVKARAWEVSQREEVIKQDVARQCETEQARLHHLQAEVNATQQQLDTLTKAIEQARQTQEQMNTEFKTLENHMQKRLTELRQEPLHLLADLQLATALPATLFQSHLSEPRDQVAVHGQDSFFMTPAPTINDPRDSLWTKIAKQHGTTINSVRTCAAALLTGFIPAVYESAAWSVLQAVAQTIAGLRIWSIPVPLTALAPLDLFGKMNMDQQAFFPTSDLADILIEAQAHPKQLGLVILEGIDRVPFQPVIAPLLRHYRLVRQHMQRNEQASYKETLPLFPVHTLSANDPYQRISRLNWPPNLLLAATFDHEANSFSFPAHYTSWFATIEKRNTTNSTREDEQIVREISSATWYAWERDIPLQDLSFPLELEQWQQGFYQALHFLGMKNDQIKFIEQIWSQS